MKFTGLFLAFFLMASIVFAQNTQYSRVEIAIEHSNLSQIANLGLNLNDGVSYEKGILTAEFSETDLAKLDENGFSYNIVIEDLVDYYRKNANQNTEIIRGEKTPDNFNLGSMGGNLTLAELLVELDDMQTLYPSLITVKTPITTDYTTHNDNPIYWVKISDNPDVNENEPEILYTALHHAREPVSMMQLVYQMWYMLENYEAGGEPEYLIDNFEMYFVLCVNPDGYTYNEQIAPNGGGMWRKNCRDNNGGGFSGEGDGVDINRNYAYQWGYDDEGSSPYPDSETYRGTSAGSEPESQMIMEFANNHEFLICDNHHTYSNLLLYPWGYEELEGPHEEIFDAYGEVMTRENGFTAGHGWEILYTANGGTNDWMYGEHEIFAFTSETGNEFWPPQNEITALCENNLEMNFFQTRLAGAYAEANDISPAFMPLAGYIDLDIQFLGLDTLADFTVSVYSDDFQTVGGGIFFTETDYSLLTKVQDSIFYILNEGFEMGDEFTFTISVDNGLYAYTHEVTKTIGKLTTIIIDNGNNLDLWTSNDWTVTEEESYSPSNSITDSEGSNYYSNTNSSITLTNSLDLSSYSNPILSYYAKWEIENNWDYVQILISENGGNSWTPLTASNTDIGEGSFQPIGEPVYDGSSNWVNEVVNVSDFQQDNIKFRFNLMSDENTEFDGFYFDDFSINYNNLTNSAPVITGQEDININVNESVVIPFNKILVTDTDSDYPSGFLLFTNGGENYTLSGNTITPDLDFNGEIAVPITVHDGFAESNSFNFTINVGTVSIENVENDIVIYPNPAKNNFTVILNNNNINKIELTDITGKQILEQNIKNTDKIDISTANIQSGIYFIKLSGNKTITKKIIINK